MIMGNEQIDLEDLKMRKRSSQMNPKIGTKNSTTEKRNSTRGECLETHGLFKGCTIA